jgi:hypothetical protein
VLLGIAAKLHRDYPKDRRVLTQALRARRVAALPGVLLLVPLADGLLICVSSEVYSGRRLYTHYIHENIAQLPRTLGVHGQALSRRSRCRGSEGGHGGVGVGVGVDAYVDVDVVVVGKRDWSLQKFCL